MKNLKTILTLLIGAVIGFSFCQLFHGNRSHAAATVSVADAPATDLEKQMAASQMEYEEKISQMEVKTQNLNRRLADTKTSLEKTRKSNIQLQTQVFALIDRQGYYQEHRDTAGFYEGCDTLQTRVTQLIKLSEEQDSLHTSYQSNLQEQLSQKDSLLQLRESQFQLWDKTLAVSLTREKALEAESRFYKKKYKRQRLGSKLKTLAILIVSGFAAKQLIH